MSNKIWTSPTTEHLSVIYRIGVYLHAHDVIVAGDDDAAAASSRKKVKKRKTKDGDSGKSKKPRRKKGKKAQDDAPAETHFDVSDVTRRGTKNRTCM